MRRGKLDTLFSSNLLVLLLKAQTENHGVGGSIRPWAPFTSVTYRDQCEAELDCFKAELHSLERRSVLPLESCRRSAPIKTYRPTGGAAVPIDFLVRSRGRPFVAWIWSCIVTRKRRPESRAGSYSTDWTTPAKTLLVPSAICPIIVMATRASHDSRQRRASASLSKRI